MLPSNGGPFNPLEVKRRMKCNNINTFFFGFTVLSRVRAVAKLGKSSRIAQTTSDVKHMVPVFSQQTSSHICLPFLFKM